MKKTCTLAVLLMASGLAGAAVAQTITPPPAPVDGTPSNPGTTTAAPAPAAPGAVPLPLTPGPGMITIIVSPDLLQRILDLFRGMSAQNPVPPVPPPTLSPVPPLAGPNGLPPGAPDPATLPGNKKKEAAVPGFPLISLKGKKTKPDKGGLIRTGPGLALTMYYIQQGNQQTAVQVLQQTVQQIDAAKAKFPKLKPGKQAAATRAALQIGLQTAVAPIPGAPAAPTGTSTTTAVPAGPTSTIPGAVPAGGQAGPPPEPIAQTPPTPEKPLPPPLPPTPDKPLPQPPMPPCNPAFVQAVAAAQKQSSPIVLDLNGNGVADVTTPDYTGDKGAWVAAGSSHFDVSGSGEKLRTEWLKPHADGLLVLDANGNGVVDSATELFGDADGFADGYAKLAQLDRNGDGALTGDELARLSAWVDDGDGVSERGELTPLATLGVTSVQVTHANYVSSFVRNGRKVHSWDWFPRSE